MSEYTPPNLSEAVRATGRTMESAPIDRPILVWCDHEADTYQEGDSSRLTLYAAHYDGLAHAPTGWAIVEWGGAFDDTSHEDFGQGAWLPDWWFVKDSEFEVAANPILWWPLPDHEGPRP